MRESLRRREALAPLCAREPLFEKPILPKHSASSNVSSLTVSAGMGDPA